MGHKLHFNIYILTFNANSFYPKIRAIQDIMGESNFEFFPIALGRRARSAVGTQRPKSAPTTHAKIKPHNSPRTTSNVAYV